MSALGAPCRTSDGAPVALSVGTGRGDMLDERTGRRKGGTHMSRHDKLGHRYWWLRMLRVRGN